MFTVELFNVVGQHNQGTYVKMLSLFLLVYLSGSDTKPWKYTNAANGDVQSLVLRKKG